MAGNIPQLVSITSVTAEGKLTLKKAVRQYLGIDGRRKLYLERSREVIVSADAGRGKPVEIDSKNRICLSGRILDILGIKSKEQVALVERGNAVAVKAFRLMEEQGDYARVVDIETDHDIIRKVETNPEPERFLSMLVERYSDAKLRYDLFVFLKGRESYEAWQARRVLGIAEKSDNQLWQTLIDGRFNSQHENGSWENGVPVTARNLCELAGLGITRKNPILRKITEIYLWNYAGLQNNEYGSFNSNPERTFTDLQFVLLQIFSRYKHPAARLVILRALPWIINNQNKDGSWGKGPYKDVATLAVVQSCVSLGDCLPANFINSN